MTKTSTTRQPSLLDSCLEAMIPRSRLRQVHRAALIRRLPGPGDGAHAVQVCVTEDNCVWTRSFIVQRHCDTNCEMLLFRRNSAMVGPTKDRHGDARQTTQSRSHLRVSPNSGPVSDRAANGSHRRLIRRHVSNSSKGAAVAAAVTATDKMALNKAAPGSPDSSNDTPLPPYPRTTLHAPRQSLPKQPLRKLPSTAHAVDAEAFPDSAATDIDRLASVSGVISPFHARKSPLRVPRPPMPPQAQRSDIYNRVRRRSPLCHDVLEFMLEGASVSSQESLVSNDVCNGDEHTVNPDAYAAHSNAPPNLRSSETACVSVGQPNSRNSTSNPPHSVNTATHATGAEQGVHVECLADSHAPAEHPHWSEQSDIDDGDCGSDSSGDGDSDNGFDGQCDGMSLTATTESTAECSRSGSYRSSKSDSSDVSDASASSTSTEPSLKWWKRHFKSKSKTQLQEVSMPGVLLRRSTVSAHAPHACPASAASSSSIAPMLTRLKRSVSSKSAANKQSAPELKKPRAAAAVETAFPQSKLSRASFISGSLLRSKSTSTKSMQLMPALPNARPATAAPNSACANSAAPTRPQTAGSVSEDAYVARWTMLKCKGMDNLHVVSVPAAIGSLNHKDAFLFYPCLFHTPDPSQPASKPQPTANKAGNLRENDMDSYEAMGAKRMHGGTLLAQEYSRRKSVCLLASRTIYIWLGAHASPIKRDAITRVAMEIRDKELLGKAAVVLVDESAAANSARKKFFAQLHLSEHGDCLAQPKDMSVVYNQITPLRRAGDDLDFERALQRRKVMYGFWEAVPPATIIAAGTYVNAAALSKVPAGGAIVLDTWSDVFIWWRNEPCSLAVRRCAINFANMLIKDVSIPPRPQSASVWHETQGSEHVIFKTKFPDWPFVFASSMSSIEVARQMAPASSSATPPMALPIRSASRHIRPVVAA